MNIVYVNNIESYHKSLNFLSLEKELALDIETYVLPQYKGLFDNAFNPHNCGISTIQLKGKNSDVYVFDVLELTKLNYDSSKLRDLLLDKDCVICHNASFEAKHLKKYWGVYLKNLWCTRVAAQLISNAFGSKFTKSASDNSLAMVCKDYLQINIEGKGTTQIEDWYIRPLSKEKLAYAATDTLYLFQLKEIFESVLLAPAPDCYTPANSSDWGLDMKEIVDLEMAFINVEAECEFNGLPVNLTTLNSFESILGEPLDSNRKKDYEDNCEISRVAGELCTHVGLSTRQSRDLSILYPVPTTDALKVLKSPIKLIPIINKFIGKASTSEGQIVRRIITLLEQVLDNGSPDFYCDEEETNYKEFEQLLESEALNRLTIGKLLVKFKMYLKQAGMKLSLKVHRLTGRIHYSFNSLGAATGRSSSSNPNSQNINAKVEVPLKVTIDNYKKYFEGTSLPTEKL